MSCIRTNDHEVEPVAGAMHFPRDPLDCETVGVTVVECEPGWTGTEHGHADADHEEVYLLLEGAATVHVDGESTFVLAGAPRARAVPGSPSAPTTAATRF